MYIFFGVHKMQIQPLRKEYLESFLKLAEENESFFGPMVDSPDFIKSYYATCRNQSGYCIINESEQVVAAIIVSRKRNEIDWLAVSNKNKGRGYGKLLLKKAIDELSDDKIKLLTFADEYKEGVPARNLYKQFGFTDVKGMGLNPAGYDIVLMERIPI